MHIDFHDFRLGASECLRRRLSRIPSLPEVQLLEMIVIVNDSVVLVWYTTRPLWQKVRIQMPVHLFDKRRDDD